MRSLALVVVLFASGCVTRGAYTVARADLEELARTPPPARERMTLLAERDDGARLHLHATAIDPLAIPPTVDRVRVTARAFSPMVATGVVLTVVGSLMSIVGTSSWLALRGGPHGDVADDLFGVELAGEPLMLAGTILWIEGLLRPAQEAR